MKGVNFAGLQDFFQQIARSIQQELAK